MHKEQGARLHNVRWENKAIHQDKQRRQGFPSNEMIIWENQAIDQDEAKEFLPSEQSEHVAKLNNGKRMAMDMKLKISSQSHLVAVNNALCCRWQG